jgi:hypothetical protein
MSTRRGWQAMVGELEAVLRHLNVAQGADAQVRDGQLWIRHHPRQPWVAAMRIPATLAARTRCWVATYIAAATQRTAPVQPFPHCAGAVAAPAASTPTPASGTRRCDSPLYRNLRYRYTIRQRQRCRSNVHGNAVHPCMAREWVTRTCWDVMQTEYLTLSFSSCHCRGKRNWRILVWLTHQGGVCLPQDTWPGGCRVHAEAVIAVLIALAVSFGLGRYRRTACENWGEAAVRRALTTHFPGPSYHLMNNLTLPYADGTTQIDPLNLSHFVARKI